MLHPLEFSLQPSAPGEGLEEKIPGEEGIEEREEKKESCRKGWEDGQHWTRAEMREKRVYTLQIKFLAEQEFRTISCLRVMMMDTF